MSTTPIALEDFNDGFRTVAFGIPLGEASFNVAQQSNWFSGGYAWRNNAAKLTAETKVGDKTVSATATSKPVESLGASLSLPFVITKQQWKVKTTVQGNFTKGACCPDLKVSAEVQEPAYRGIVTGSVTSGFPFKFTGSARLVDDVFVGLTADYDALRSGLRSYRYSALFNQVSSIRNGNVLVEYDAFRGYSAAVAVLVNPYTNTNVVAKVNPYKGLYTLGANLRCPSSAAELFGEATWSTKQKSDTAVQLSLWSSALRKFRLGLAVKSSLENKVPGADAIGVAFSYEG